MSFFTQPFELADLRIGNRTILAPLAGVSDVPFRRICREFGASLCYVEMLSARAIIHSSKRTFYMMARHEDEELLGVQVTGATPEEVADAIEFLDRQGFDTIDINMGCPVRKIVAKGWGSAIPRDQDRLSEMLERARAATRRPLSLKCRLGYNKNEFYVEPTIEKAAAAHLDMVTIHGRMKGDKYCVPVDVDTMRGAFEKAGSMVTVGNGDVLDHASAQTMVDKTGCDAVMVSRGALGNPWIFKEILEGKDCHPQPDEWLDVVLQQIDYHEQHYGPSYMTTVTARKHVLWYLTGYPNIRRARDRVGAITDMDEMRNAVRSFAATLPRDLRRYEDASLAESA